MSCWFDIFWVPLQVDLKLKICRGTSIRKIIVREANAYLATDVIVGTANHTIRSSASVAKYCARKLPKDCSVLAVNNGKVVFQREASLASYASSKGWHCICFIFLLIEQDL